METVFIDGSTGEGGGQILRTSLALSCVTGRSLHIENIRAARRNPGLGKQHLVCVQAACEISNARCEGAALGSKVLDFEPKPVRSGHFRFDIGSAGSASLVIQTVLPALFLAYKPSSVTVTGGTHNPMAPPFDFLKETFLPAVSTIGFRGNCKLFKHGFYPAGGGRMTFSIQGSEEQPQQAIELAAPDKHFQIRARIYTARLPAHIAQRQEKLLLKSGLDIEDVEHIEVTDSDGPGNCVMIRLCPRRFASQNRSSGGSRTPLEIQRSQYAIKSEREKFLTGRTTVFTAYGQRGKPSRDVVKEVVGLAGDFIASGAVIDRFLADQLLIYMALNCHFAKSGKIGARSESGGFTTNELSTHLLTNMEVIKKFLPVDFSVEQQDKVYAVSCRTA